MQHDLPNLFSESTIKLKTLTDSMDPSMELELFNKLVQSIDKVLLDGYKSDDEDIEDMGDLIQLLNLLIDKMWINKELANKYFELLPLRKRAKKLTNKKYREGALYLGIKKSMVPSGNINSRSHSGNINSRSHSGNINSRSHSEEKPRKYFNVTQCLYQYEEIYKFVWVESTEEIKQKYDGWFNTEIDE